MTSDEAESRIIDLPTWLDGLAGLDDLAGVTVSRDEQRALLELTRIAAHRSDRIAAPITAYLAGLALASLSPAGRAEALARVLDCLGPDRP